MKKIGAKIRLSAKEQELAANKDFILTKNGIIRKTQLFFGELAEEQTKICLTLPSLQEFISIPPKISKGENYKGFPWLVLDYPRIFLKEDVFTIRTMFWWGHCFSITLHLAGKYKLQFESKITGAYSLLKNENLYCCINKEQWQHHFEKDNYIPVNEFSAKEFSNTIALKPFLKIAASCGLADWDNAGEAMLRHFVQFVQIIK
jgi:hypothetical protein